MTSIDWHHLSLEAKETDLKIGEMPESELWDIDYFGEFRVRLVNGLSNKTVPLDVGGQRHKILRY